MKNKFMFAIVSLFGSATAFADAHEGAMVAAGVAAAGMGDAGLLGLAAAIGIGVAALGGALGQGRIGAAAMDGIARNPQAGKAMFVPMILGLVLIESLVIYGLLVSFGMAGSASEVAKIKAGIQVEGVQLLGK